MHIDPKADEEYAWVPFLLQTADALFPTGAYAHSQGFEECVRLGIVRDEVTLRTFLYEQIVPGQREQELPYLRFATEAAAANDLTLLCSLDREVNAWKLPQESRDASMQLGNRRLKALQAVSKARQFTLFAKAIERDEACGHHLIVCGLQAAVAEIPLQVALGAYFYQMIAGICGAALKLIRIGQEGIQRVLRQVCLETAAVVRSSYAVQRECTGWFNPLLEIASMRHARADERLFIS